MPASVSTHSPVAEHFATEQQQHESATFGMWLFLLTEIMLFGGLFTTYAIYRWLYWEGFAAGSRHLDVGLGTINTSILIGSSFTMALAHHAAVAQNRKHIVLCLTLTALFAAIFLGIKSYEYVHKFEERLVPGPQFVWRSASGNEDADPVIADQAELFFGLYFVMTGIHAFHMILGILVILAMIAAAFAGKRIATHAEMMGLYWHFVDIVWILLFPLLYLIDRHS
jgi:cytochrome c oxidase subunit 3